MVVIYLAGPYRSDTTFGTKQNILAAERAGIEIAKLGAVPLVPHVLFQFWDGLLDDQWFIDATLELMRRCDAVLILPGSDWKTSKGTLGEIEAAEEAKIPIFWSLPKLHNWLSTRDQEAEKLSFVQQIRRHFYKRLYWPGLDGNT